MPDHDTEGFAYVITLDGREAGRHRLTTDEFDPEDPMFDPRRDALRRLRALQAEGRNPQAWILTTDELDAIDAGTLTYGDLPEFAHLPTSRSPHGDVTDQLHWMEREADREDTFPDLRYRLQLVHDGQRTLVAAFATPWLADLASTLFSTIPSRPDLAWDRYEVEGLRVDEDPHPLQLQLNSQELLATAVLPPG